MKSFAEALSTPEMGKLIAASLERDEKRSEEALRWLLGDEAYEQMRRSVEVDQIADRFVGVPATPWWEPIGGRPISPDLEASATHGVGSTPSQPTETKPRVPRVGDWVRVVHGEPPHEWIGSTGHVTLDLHGVEGREAKPWNVRIDGVPKYAPHLGAGPVIAFGDDEIEVIDDGVGSTRTVKSSPCVREDGCILPDGHQDHCQRSDGSVILRRRPIVADGTAAQLGRALVATATMNLQLGNNGDAVTLVELYIRLVEIHADARVG